MPKKEIAKYNHSRHQMLSCHAWLFPVAYGAVHCLREKHPISISGFTVLITAYLYKRKGHNGFKAKDILSQVLPWQHNRIYRHLRHLEIKGYVRIEKNPYSSVQFYFLTSEGEKIVRAYNQHFIAELGVMWERLGEFPASFSSLTP